MATGSGTTSAPTFCHRLSAHQTHQNPSKIVSLALKYNYAADHPRKNVRDSEKTVPESYCPTVSALTTKRKTKATI